MSQIEKLYYAWTESDLDPEELRHEYRKTARRLDELVGKEQADEIDVMYMNCIYIEKIEAFKAGFRRASALWKECFQLIW